MKRYTPIYLLVIVLFTLLTVGCQSTNEDVYGDGATPVSFSEQDKEKTSEDGDTKQTLGPDKKISAYLEEECRKAFSPYYEVISCNIISYEETITDNGIEAIIDYQMINKNYDKDPDTVAYIKEAKDNNDPNYQTYYDEYLLPQESNFQIKAVLKSDDSIELFTDLSPHGEGQWSPFQFSDCIIK